MMTKSQKIAIEQQKRIFSNIYPKAEYHIWQPKNTNITMLIANYEMDSMLPDIKIKLSASWIIGKRGKVSNA
jgi:hypothetical protein